MRNDKIRIAVVGVGNCVSSLVQGLAYYSNKAESKIGLTSRVLGGYDISDIQIVAAYDIDKRKIGKPLKQAIFSEPNCATIFETTISGHEVEVRPGPLLDGMPLHMYDYKKEKRFWPAEETSGISQDNVVAYLKKTRPHFLICYLPVGSVNAAAFYAECAIEANISFINAMPVFIASDKTWIKRFKTKKLLIIGDDVKSQVGATILHRSVANIFYRRGAKIHNTHQINIGGNTDFLNMMDKKRLNLKWQSKIESVKSQCDINLENIYAGPAEYIEFLKDRKIAYINMEGVGFGNLPIKVDIKLEVDDSTNSAGVMIDIIRMAKIEQNQGKYGELNEISAYGFKRPLHQFSDGHLFGWMKNFLLQNNDDKI